MLRIFPICCAILLNWTSVCLSQNLKTEPNNDLSSATMILSGSQVEGSLFDRNDQDYYRLSLADRQEALIGDNILKKYETGGQVNHIKRN